MERLLASYFHAVCVQSTHKLGGSGGMPPQNFFTFLDLLRWFLSQFQYSFLSEVTLALETQMIEADGLIYGRATCRAAHYIAAAIQKTSSRTASVPKRGILFAPEVGVTAQKWPHFARVRPFEESRWSVAEWIFAGFSTLPMEALVVVFMD